MENNKRFMGVNIQTVGYFFGVLHVLFNIIAIIVCAKEFDAKPEFTYKYNDRYSASVTKSKVTENLKIYIGVFIIHLIIAIVFLYGILKKNRWLILPQVILAGIVSIVGIFVLSHYFDEFIKEKSTRSLYRCVFSLLVYVILVVEFVFGIKLREWLRYQLRPIGTNQIISYNHGFNSIPTAPEMNYPTTCSYPVQPPFIQPNPLSQQQYQYQYQLHQPFISKS